MKLCLTTAFLCLALAGTPILVGCDREVSHDETVKKNANGTMSKDSTTVTQKPDGTVVKEKEHEQTGTH